MVKSIGEWVLAYSTTGGIKRSEAYSTPEETICFNCENGLIHNPYWFDGPMVCPYCRGTGHFERIEIDHRKYKAGAWGYWRDWSIHCLKCDKLLDYRNAVQPDKCPACGYGGEA